MATKAELAERVLQKLMVLEHGETMDTGDQDLVESAYDSAYALLNKRRLVTWGSGDDIPVGAEIPIINYVADATKESFSVPFDIRQVLPFEAQQSIVDLTILASPEYVSDETPAQYY